MKATINDGFYGFVEQRYQNITGVPSRNMSSKKFADISEAYELLHNLSPIIPKVCSPRLRLEMFYLFIVAKFLVDCFAENEKINIDRNEGQHKY